jgi:hypothetical protein
MAMPVSYYVLWQLWSLICFMTIMIINMFYDNYDHWYVLWQSRLLMCFMII